MKQTCVLQARARTWIVPVALLLGVLGALLPSALRPTAAFGASGSITSFISRPGDQVITVPNGTYTGGGTVNAPHPATAGRYKGWLVLVAQSKGGVTVDLSTSNLTLGPSTSRVLFVGFKFVNGMFVVQGDDITFWYTEHTFPPEEWNRQYQAAGSDMLAMQNPVPKGLWVGQGANRVVRRISVLGADVHDITDDGLFFGGTQGDTVAGTRIWNLDHKGYDPPSPWRPGSDRLRNESIQVPGR